MQQRDGVARQRTALAQTKPASGRGRADAYRVVLAALTCAFYGCASPTSPARNADAESSGARPSRGESSHEGGRSGNAAPSSAARGSGADTDELPWLSASHVGAAVRAHHGDFQACQALGDLESRREDGAITVGWQVRPDGGVNDVTLGPSTFQSARINSCVLAVARQVTFPRSATPAQVSWTVKFRGGAGAPVATVH